jgi:hypothetical protein
MHGLHLAAFALLLVELLRARMELVTQRAHPDSASLEFC